MKNFFKRYYALIIGAIMFVIFNILALTLTDLKAAKTFFWVGYSFTLVTFIAVTVALVFIRTNKHVNVNAVFPAYIVSGVYFALSLIINIIYMAMPTKDDAKASIIPNVILLLLYAAALIVALRALSHIADSNKEVTEKVTSLRQTAIEINSISNLCDNAEVKSALAKLKEEVEYSDPMGVEGSQESEENFKKSLAAIRVLVEDGEDAEMILKKIRVASNRLEERNALLRTLK